VRFVFGRDRAITVGEVRSAGIQDVLLDLTVEH
jgi:hypothetical protein